MISSSITSTKSAATKTRAPPCKSKMVATRHVSSTTVSHVSQKIATADARITTTTRPKATRANFSTADSNSRPHRLRAAPQTGRDRSKILHTTLAARPVDQKLSNTNKMRPQTRPTDRRRRSPSPPIGCKWRDTIHPQKDGSANP